MTTDEVRKKLQNGDRRDSWYSTTARDARLSSVWHVGRKVQRATNAPSTFSRRKKREKGSIRKRALDFCFADFVRNRIQHIAEMREGIAVPETQHRIAL